jgi:hypothetical protein
MPLGEDRGRWCWTATLSGQASKQAKKIFLRGFPLHQLQRHFFYFGFTIPRCFFLSILSSLQLYNNIGILLPLAATAAQHCTAQHSSAQHRSPSVAPLSQQSSICLRSLTPPSRVREYLAFLFPLLKHDGTHCASSPSCWLCRASQFYQKLFLQSSSSHVQNQASRFYPRLCFTTAIGANRHAFLQMAGSARSPTCGLAKQ